MSAIVLLLCLSANPAEAAPLPTAEVFESSAGAELEGAVLSFRSGFTERKRGSFAEMLSESQRSIWRRTPGGGRESLAGAGRISAMPVPGGFEMILEGEDLPFFSHPDAPRVIVFEYVYEGSTTTRLRVPVQYPD